MPRVRFQRLASALVLFVTFVACSGQVANAAQIIINYSKSLNGGGTLRVVIDSVQGSMVSALAPTSVGDVSVTLVGNGAWSEATFVLVGTQQVMSVRLETATQIVTSRANFGAQLGEIVYAVDTANGVTSLVSSTVSDCSLVQQTSLYKALLEVEAMAEAIQLHYKASANQVGHALTVRAFATYLSASTSFLSTCGVMNPHWAYGCGNYAPNKEECETCCGDWTILATGGSWAVTSLMPLSGPAVGGMTYLEDRRCREGCREAFPENPPTEGQECGIWPWKGVCRSMCTSGEHEGAGTGCSVAHLCCIPDAPQ